MSTPKRESSISLEYDGVKYDSITALVEATNLPRRLLYNRLSKGKYLLIRCAVCGREVLLSHEEALVFKHSDDCVKNEWL